MTEPVVLVTGASRGIGLAITTFLLESFGTRVITISRSITPQLKDLSTKYSDRIVIVQGDITNASVHEEAVTSAQQKYNRLDAVILNAGTVEPLGRVTDPEVSIDGWKSVFDVNFFLSLAHTQGGHPCPPRESRSHSDGIQWCFYCRHSCMGGIFCQ